jgi:hypothetical protein
LQLASEPTDITLDACATSVSEFIWLFLCCQCVKAALRKRLYMPFAESPGARFLPISIVM